MYLFPDDVEPKAPGFTHRRHREGVTSVAWLLLRPEAGRCQGLIRVSELGETSAGTAGRCQWPRGERRPGPARAAI